MALIDRCPELETVRVRFQGDICYLQLHRPEAGNTVNGQLIHECLGIVERYRADIKILVIEGLPDIFCAGADFKWIKNDYESQGRHSTASSEPLYDLWLQLATGPFITIAHVKGRVNAGGIGFVAASDIVLSDEKATFSLSELLFGLIPSCVLPFLIRRTGYSRANHMALLSRPFSVEQARSWGLVDDYHEDSENLLRMYLLRLRRISKKSISRYKQYLGTLDNSLSASKLNAVVMNQEVFSDPDNLQAISRYVDTGLFPWDK